MPDNTKTAREQREDFYSDEELRKRGWTDDRIKQVLGNPNIRGVSLHHRTGSPICFYLKERVHRAEQPGVPSGDVPSEVKLAPPGLYTFDQEKLVDLLHSTIDAFMDYQFRYGYEEPRARQEAIRAIIERLEDGEDVS